jgi:septal ring factor EnvC (AmiA/AmiB activator)
MMCKKLLIVSLVLVFSLALLSPCSSEPGTVTMTMAEFEAISDVLILSEKTIQTLSQRLTTLSDQLVTLKETLSTQSEQLQALEISLRQSEKEQLAMMTARDTWQVVAIIGTVSGLAIGLLVGILN